MFWGAAVVYDESVKPNVLSKRMLAQRPSIKIIQQLLAQLESERPNADQLSKMIYLELKLRLPELLLMRVDKITMATSVEARVPFLDHHLVEYAMSLPPEMKVNGRTGKYILKRALETILPHDLLYSKKRGFGAPIREWFRGSAGDEFGDRLLNSPIKKRDFFNYDFIERILAEQREDESIEFLRNLRGEGRRWEKRPGPGVR